MKEEQEKLEQQKREQAQQKKRLEENKIALEKAMRIKQLEAVRVVLADNVSVFFISLSTLPKIPIGEAVQSEVEFLKSAYNDHEIYDLSLVPTPERASSYGHLVLMVRMSPIAKS